MGAAVPFVAPHCLPQPGAINWRVQAWDLPFLTKPCTASTAIPPASWPPSPPTGQSNSCRFLNPVAGSGTDQPLDQTHALSGTRLTWLVDLVGRLATAHQRQGEQDPAVQQAIGAA